MNSGWADAPKGQPLYGFGSLYNEQNSGWADLNRRPPDPQSGTLTNCATARIRKDRIENIMIHTYMSIKVTDPHSIRYVRF